jgi:hypothetical protein
MHGEETVIDLGAEKVIVRERELDPNKKGFGAADQQEEHRKQDVEYAEALMINGHYPLMEFFDKSLSLPATSNRFE